MIFIKSNIILKYEEQYNIFGYALYNLFIICYNLVNKIKKGSDSDGVKRKNDTVKQGITIKFYL